MAVGARRDGITFVGGVSSELISIETWVHRGLCCQSCIPRYDRIMGGGQFSNYSAFRR